MANYNVYNFIVQHLLNEKPYQIYTFHSVLHALDFFFSIKIEWNKFLILRGAIGQLEYNIYTSLIILSALLAI